MSLLRKTIHEIIPRDDAYLQRAHERINRLTMPPRALGRLLDLAETLAAITRSLNPPTARRVVVVMAADHGVAEEGVSAFPQDVTRQMVANFARGGAAINVLARQAGADVVVVDIGVAGETPRFEKLPEGVTVLDRKVASGTNNFAKGSAMTREQAIRSIETGIAVTNALAEKGLDILAPGDMGIGNTTASSAITAVLTGMSVSRVTGRGTGINDDALAKKIKVIEKAIALNKPRPSDAIDVLSKVGGFEIGGIAGCFLAGAALKIPVIIDGFISAAGALIASRICPGCHDYMIASHLSEEKGHAAILDALHLKPYLNLGLRLGEGTGACLMIHLIEAAKRILTEMATFDDAGVSGKIC